MRISDWSSDVCSSDLSGSGGSPEPGCCLRRAGGTIGRIAWWRDLKVRQFDRMRRPARRWRGWRWLHPQGGSMPEPPEHDNRRGKTHLVSMSAAGAARAPWNLHLLAALVRRDFKAQYRRSLIGPAWAILRSDEHTSELQQLMRNT